MPGTARKAVPKHAAELRRFHAMDQRVALENAFTLAGPERNVFVLGDPGSGKTTALEKLAWEVVKLDTGFDATAIGLPKQTLPVFLRLRSLTGALLAEPLAAFVQAELDKG